MANEQDLQQLEGVKTEYQYGFHDDGSETVFRAEKGLKPRGG